ncbi:hypothetical protein HPB50_021942 [Hyalomma asiaticum]|uniref:Uncharacterized protein n=1 Tax=Hyalomma asiaticum TaxID=266040 RepID=A0ACB7SM59_HYAAI|nr:hypothetical protein HPB50_021942 [Hyalomma asiaticum]
MHAARACTAAKVNVQATKRCSPRCVQEPPASASHRSPGCAGLGNSQPVGASSQLRKHPCSVNARVQSPTAVDVGNTCSDGAEAPLPFEDTAQRRIDRGAERAALPFTQMSFASGAQQRLLSSASCRVARRFVARNVPSPPPPRPRRRCKFIAPTIALRTRSPALHARRTPDTVLTRFHCGRVEPLRTPTQAARIRRAFHQQLVARAETGALCVLVAVQCVSLIAQSPRGAPLHTSCAQHGLMEFFEPKENWGADEVRSGKSWSKDELRIKSNSDLHKLCKFGASGSLAPFAVGVLDEVKESMNNLEEVVRERNEAYYLLETGESGEQPWTPKENIYGFVCNFALNEHLMPRKCNPKGYFRLWRDKDLDEFLRLYREKMQKRKEFFHRRARNRIMQIIKRFPNVDRSLLREMYPDVDIDKLEKIMKEKIYVAFEQQTTT